MTDIEPSKIMADQNGGLGSKYETFGRLLGIFTNLTNFDCHSQEKEKKKKKGLVMGILRDFKLNNCFSILLSSDTDLTKRKHKSIQRSFYLHVSSNIRRDDLQLTEF